MSKVLDGLLYTKEHEWALIEGEVATVGITDHAQSSLGDVVFLELPEPGKTITQHDRFGVVESVKAVSDLFAPLSGEVIEVNAELVQSPEKINYDPYLPAWMIKVRISNTGELKDLLDHRGYSAYLAEHNK